MNSNIPAGYTDEGIRGVSPEQVELIEKNWDSINAYLEKKEKVYCVHCDRPMREAFMKRVGDHYLCEDCQAELNM